MTGSLFSLVLVARGVELGEILAKLAILFLKKHDDVAKEQKLFVLCASFYGNARALGSDHVIW
jgi:hypothetical protein